MSSLIVGSQTLPLELVGHIASFMSDGTMQRYSMVSKEARAVTRDDMIKRHELKVLKAAEKCFPAIKSLVKNNCKLGDNILIHRTTEWLTEYRYRRGFAIGFGIGARPSTSEYLIFCVTAIWAIILSNLIVPALVIAFLTFLRYSRKIMLIYGRFRLQRSENYLYLKKQLERYDKAIQLATDVITLENRIHKISTDSFLNSVKNLINRYRDIQGEEGDPHHYRIRHIRRELDLSTFVLNN
ncbi:MAG: hypothetical protein H0X51_01135 [Parachlamydiaceae bacterium]|nr:hypothetical protein [Parachlamydiaceae bacterium]